MLKRARPGPRTKPPDERRDDLMSAAQQLFLEKGLASTTIEQITEAANVGKGTFYFHFRSKEDVLASLRERYIQDFIARIDADVSRCKADDWKGKLGTWARSAVVTTLRTTALHDAVFAIHARERVPVQPESGRLILKHLAALLSDGHAAGAWRVDDPMFTAEFLFEGLHATLESRDQSFDRDLFVAKVKKIFFRAVARLDYLEAELVRK